MSPQEDAQRTEPPGEADGSAGALVPGGALLTDYRLQQRDYLLRIARAMSGRLDLREVLALVIRSAVTMTNGQAGAIALRREDGRFDLAARYRLEEKLVVDLTAWLDEATADADADAAAADARPRQEVWPADSSPAPLARILPRSGGEAHQVLTLPLIMRENEIGQILVFRSEGAAVFTPLDGQLLRAFADQAAVAIQNAFLHERLAARERQLATVVDHSAGGILLTDRDGRVLTHNPAATALVGCEPGQLRGCLLAEALGVEDEAGRPVALPLPSSPGTTTVHGYLRRPGEDRRAYVQVTVNGLSGGDSGIESYVAAITDLTVYKEGEDSKTAFLAGLSHELKTPLALIRGFAETLRMDEARQDPALFEESVDVILDETDHLTGMVDQLLHAAQVQTGQLRLDIDVVAVGDLVERVVAQFARTHPDRAWQVTIPADLPPIAGDGSRLREVFANLLANAVKYSAAGSRVAVEAGAGADGVRVVVRDEGIGIAPADQARIFDRFVRASDQAEGTGLGLYMSRAIVAAHGGRIEVESAPGRGSAFTVVLPYAPPAAPRATDPTPEAGGRRGAE